MGSVRYLDHTADAAAEITAATREELFALGARALYGLVLDYDAVTCRLERRLELAAADFAELFHAWLAELIYLLDAERLAFARFDFTFGPDGRTLVATAAGEEVDAARHHPHGEVKNVTYAEYAVHASADGYTARVIFDL